MSVRDVVTSLVRKCGDCFSSPRSGLLCTVAGLCGCVLGGLEPSASTSVSKPAPVIQSGARQGPRTESECATEKASTRSVEGRQKHATLCPKQVSPSDRTLKLGYEVDDCGGFDAFTKCWDACQDPCNDACADYGECLADASDTCNALCFPLGCCLECGMAKDTCMALCTRELDCGKTKPGGACEEVGDCCAKLPELRDRYSCALPYAGVALSDGDPGCSLVFRDGTLCPATQ